MLLAVADVLVDAALVLGGDAVLKILYMKLIQVCYHCPCFFGFLFFLFFVGWDSVKEYKIAFI